MKRISILFAVIAISFASCVKKIIENTKNNPATDFQLKLTRTNASGISNQQVENALNLPGSANFVAAFYAKETSVHIKIGGAQLTTVVPRLSADIHFTFTKKVEEVAGTYTFPADNNRVSFFLNEIVNSTMTTNSLPTEGTLQISYDATSKTLNGTCTSIKYRQPLNSIYQSEILNGKFNHVAVGQ